MIYEKINPQPLSPKTRYNPAWEFMFVLVKGKWHTANLLREPCKWAGKTNTGTMRNADGDSLYLKHGYGKPIKASKVRANVWKYVVGVDRDNPGGKHPAVFPEQLAKDHILSWSNPGDLVLDPMCGSGTTLKMAKALGRFFMGIDVSAEYIALAKERILGT